MKSNSLNIFSISSLSIYILIIVFTTVILSQSNRTFGKNMENKAIEYSWEIIGSLVSLLIFNILIGVNKFTKGKFDRSTIIKYIIISLTIGLVIGGIYKAITFKDIIPNDTASKSRMDILNQIMISILGPIWGKILGAFVIILIILLATLFINTDPVSINISGNNNIYMLICLGIVTIISFVLFYIGYRKYQYDENKINKAKGNIVDKPNNTHQIIKLSLVFGFIIPLFLILFYLGIKSVISSINNTKNLRAKLIALKNQK